MLLTHAGLLAEFIAFAVPACLGHRSGRLPGDCPIILPETAGRWPNAELLRRASMRLVPKCKGRGEALAM